MELYACAASIAALFVLLLLQVISRFLLEDPPLWTEELARYGMVWVTFVGAAIATRQGTHITITTIAAWLPVGAQRALEGVAYLAVVVVSLALVPATWASVEASQGIASSASGISRAWLFGGPLAGWCGMLLYGAAALVRWLRGASDPKGPDVQEAVV